MSEKLYCVALNGVQMRAVRTALNLALNGPGLDARTRDFLLWQARQFERRLEWIDLEEQQPSPAPPPPLLSDVHEATGIKFGGDVQ